VPHAPTRPAALPVIKHLDFSSLRSYTIPHEPNDSSAGSGYGASRARPCHDRRCRIVDWWILQNLAHGRSLARRRCTLARRPMVCIRARNRALVFRDDAPTRMRLVE